MYKRVYNTKVRQKGGPGQSQLEIRIIIQKYNIKFYIIFDMLRHIGNLPPQAQGCFHDYLTTHNYTSIQGQLYECSHDTGNYPLPLALSLSSLYTDPQNYLYKLTLISGIALINTEGTIAINKTNGSTIVRSTRNVSDRACWQWNVPGSLHGIQLGICLLNTNGSLKYLPFTFNSSTARTVTFLVDNYDVKAWVNDSLPSKNNWKKLEWDYDHCYPYAKLTSKGSSVIFNPFTVEPNSKIARTNPFNSTTTSQQQAFKLNPLGLKQVANAKIIDIKQLNLDRFLLVAEGGYVKVVDRNRNTNKIEFSGVIVQQDTIYNLFSTSEWKDVAEIFKQQKLPEVQWQQNYYKIDEVLNLLRYLIIKFDEFESIHSNPKYHQIKYLLFCKLAIIRPYIHNKIPNSLQFCQIDREQHHYSQQFFKNQNSTPIRTVPSSAVTNQRPWLRLQGNLIAISEHYVCSMKKIEGDSKQSQLIIYHINDFGIKKVFTSKLSGDKFDFSKSSLLESSSDIETNLWKESSQSSQIYKILSNCFANLNSADTTIFQPKEKDINELVQVFKFSKEQAITALEQTGNLEDAISWIADTNHKINRKRKNQNGSQSEQVVNQDKVNCSIIELPDNYLTSKILLQLHNNIYIIGFSPNTFARRYIERTDKGFLSLSSFQYGANLSEIKTLNCHRGLNLGTLTILDELKLGQNIDNEKVEGLYLFNENNKIYFAFSKNEKLLKAEIEFNEENIYKEVSSLKLSQKIDSLASEQVKREELYRNINGDLYIKEQSNESIYRANSLILEGTSIRSNINSVAREELISTAQVWIKFNHPPSLIFQQSQQAIDSKFLPLLVERGPPGCNMNYPICSILYPKAPLPFLANYPYSLTFRHLHSKCMKIQQVIIQRIGEKKNVNEIKQGSIYFIDDANVQSKRYHFKFDHKNELNVKIQQQSYWRYMVIEPTYHAGSRLPYEIGFMGAKGTSIEFEEYFTAITNKIEENLDISDKIGKRRFEILKIDSLSHGTYKATLLLHSNDHKNVLQNQLEEISFQSRQNTINILMTNRRYGINEVQSQNKQKQQYEVRPNQLLLLTPEQIIAALVKPSTVSKDKRSSQAIMIFKEISKNDGLSLKQYNETQIKILIDLFISTRELSVKEFENIYEKIKRENPNGAKYLDQLGRSLGKNHMVTIEPKYMPFILNKVISKQNSSVLSQILKDLVENVRKLKNQHYKILQKEYSTPYLMLQSEYYSKYYYDQIKLIEQGSNASERCDKIFREEIISNYKFVILKESRARKILVKFTEKSSIKNILLRFDKADVHNKVSINIFAWNGNEKKFCAQALIFEHQWIQITKNPYRKEMVSMFTNNHPWLNAYGICLQNRVQATYLEFQILFNLSGISSSEEASQGTAEILPEIYGIGVGSADPVSQLEETYFKYNEEQRIFLSKVSLRLQIDSESKTKQLFCSFNKYLINKQNQIQYQIFEATDSSGGNSTLERDQQAIEFKTDIEKLVRVTSQSKDGVLLKKHNQKDIKPLLQKYHTIIRNLSDENRQIRISRKMNLDYCYTMIMWILETEFKKQITINEKNAKLLLEEIIKNEIGPVSYVCLKALSSYPDLFIDGLNYVHVSKEGEKRQHDSIPISVLKGITTLHISNTNIEKALQTKNVKLAESLTNIIINTKPMTQESIHQCILLSQLTHKHDKVISYILQPYGQAQPEAGKKWKKQRHLFLEPAKAEMYQEIIKYIYSQSVSPKERNELFIQKLNKNELEGLILTARKLSHDQKIHINIDFPYLLQRLFNDKEVKQINLDVVSLIFQINLPADEQWDCLQKCIKYCPTAQDMIHFQYLSASRDQRDQLIQLATFHRDILFSAAKLPKNSELVANILGEIFHCNKKLFAQVVMSFPENQVYQLHPDINSLIFRLLEEQCNLGGIEGAKCATFQQNVWLAVVGRLSKLSSNEIDEKTYSTPQIEGIVKWYLLNNEYEEGISNPINRSPAINNMKIIAQKVSEIINKVGGARSINRVFEIHSQIKQEIKNDSKRLLSTKHLILNRLQYGVCKLMENNLQPDNLSEVIIGHSQNKGLIYETVKQLEEEERQHINKQVNYSENAKQVDLTDELQVYSLQGATLTNIPCKDVQSYKSGSKSHAFTISAACKRLILKPTNNIDMSKFIIGFSVQETPEKNNIIPDYVELYGCKVDDIKNISSATAKKICDLHIIQDQQYTQFGVRLFGINFDCIRRKYRNDNFNVIEIRAKTLSLSSVSDVLECNQKANKNLVYHVSFIFISGHKQFSKTELLFSDVYMKMLSFLGAPGYEKTLKQFIKHSEKHKHVIQRLVQLLNSKARRTAGNKYSEIENLLITLSRNQVPILQYLLKQHQINYELVNKILKANLNTHNIDLALQKVLEKNLKEEFVNSLIELAKINSLAETKKSHKIKQAQIVDICHRYERTVRNEGPDNNKEETNTQAQLLRKILACLTTSPSMYDFNPIKLTEELLKVKGETVYYPIIAGYAAYYKQSLEMLLNTNKIDEMSVNLLAKMEQYNKTKAKQTEVQISNLICLISSVTIYPQIRLRLISNPKNPDIEKLPIKVFRLLSNEETLIQQYPTSTLKKFINLFQSTCTHLTEEVQKACSEQFASKLIEVMTKLPQVPSNYHNYFIHEFFFPIINAYNGVLVSYLWKGQKDHQGHTKYYTKPTEILESYPIRKNNSIWEHGGRYFRLVTSVEELSVNNYPKIITYNKKVIAQKVQGNKDWNFVDFSEDSEHQVKALSEYEKGVRLTLQNGQTKDVNLADSQSIFKCFVADSQIKAQLSRLLTNQTLLRVNHPSLFANHYTTSLPLTLGMHSYTYLMPAEMTIAQMLKEVNICGYKLDNKSRKKLNIYLNSTNKVPISQDQKFSSIFKSVHGSRPIIEVQINAYELFKHTTIEKIAKQNETIEQQTKFIAQQTIFKSFEKLQGLEKMIKVIMTCVKNWNNQEQNKIWTQYLSELSSFSCFPIFSSIYMNKQENVELLFNLLSGLPDKEDNNKWLKQEKKSVKALYEIIKNVFEVQGDQAITIRNYAVQSEFYETMLQRLHLITKQTKRHKIQQEQEEQTHAPMEMIKKASQDQYKKQIKKKKGIGYGNDSSSNQKWDITGHQQAKKQQSDQIIGLIKILEKFLSHPKFKLPDSYLSITYESALLPILEASLRAGSLLEISKNAQLFKEQLKIIKVLSKNQVLVPTLMDIPKTYEPKQSQSIFSLLTTLEGTSKIFLSCLNKQVSEKTSEEIAKNIIDTFNDVEEAISNYKSQHVDENADKKILELPLAKKYPILMKDLRFDYIDMKDKNGKIKHHYNSNFQAKHTPPPTKVIRLAQELADISQALPIQHTNAIYVRCDKDRVDFMQALIMGSNGTPYGHGAYLFDIYFDDSYPNNPPKVNLTTTGSGSIRFNPNLYSCGKVCLSLLGTWRGTALQNWDPKVSTLLQVLVSIQSIIMAQEIYFNEPGFEHEQGTVEGQKKNQGYSNIVRYGNIKFAMIENLKNPPKGFETVIRRHFYLKKDQILKECAKWLKFAEKREAAYTGLVSDHNHNWASTFKKTKTEYQTMLQKAIKQLQIQLNKLPEPSAKDLIKQKHSKSPKKQKKEKKDVKVQKDQNLEEIDVTYEVKPATNLKELDINDEKVKDRWSRYIGAMGLQAVNKQSKASILLFGLSSLGIQIAKNIVLSGCKRFSVCDNELTSWKDLSGQFYLSQQQINKSRVDSCLYKLQDLNNYVRVDSVNINISNLEQEDKLKEYQVIISTIHNENQLILLDNFCIKNNIKFIAVKCEGPYGFVFNNFGKLEVLDKNGQETVECFIESITNEEQGVVTLMAGQKHPYEDGEVVKITNVKGMESKDQPGVTINETVHKISVINKSSFKIGDTTKYTEYLGNGLVKNLKIPVEITFKSFEESLNIFNIDQNLGYYDFAKSVNNEILHRCFRALSVFKLKHQNNYPRAWNWDDAQQLLEIYKTIPKPNNSEQSQPTDSQKAYIYRFSFTCSGSFAPLAAFYGGLIAQEAFKAITNKYMPINQFFLTDFTEVIDELPKEIGEWKEFVESKKAYKPEESRFEGIRSIVGQETLDKIRDCKVFIVGSGAIGCELLKNYAMINLATSQKPDKGTIIVTDPDHIETSNLNRQFLFREKHLQKPKSATAAAVVKQMNKYLKGQNKIRAKLIKVCQATKDTFSNQFFESMDIVTNALDNVQARQYVDMRCVENKVALLESGTLSTKGHVQVIIPYKTETYGSKADPAQEGDIPHCTLKMFPEETLHCVEWARDIFGKTFAMKPKALAKIVETMQEYNPTPSEVSILKDCLHMLQEKPTSFDDAVLIATKQFYKFYRNDIKQLLYTYPLDAKTKDGKDFWKLPKRPPSPIQQINPDNKLHGEFITSYAVLLCKIYSIPYPKDFRTEERRQQIAKDAAKIKVQPFVPSDKVAKEMATEVQESKKDGDKMEEEQIKQKNAVDEEDCVDLFKKIKQNLRQEKQSGNTVKIHAQEFEKDDDANGHIDLIYSMANLRALNYSLQPMDWITTKLKAGRITPALSTTTSCIAALQTIQLIKYLKKLPIDQMKNTFLNLAVPIIQAGEPGQIDKIKIHEGLTTNIWERWTLDEVSLNESTMGDLIRLIEQKFKVTVKTLNLAGGGPIYSDLVLGLESKKQEKEQFMQKKFKDVLSQQISVEQIKNYVDLTLVMAVGEQFIKHVPTIRVNFKN